MKLCEKCGREITDEAALCLICRKEEDGAAPKESQAIKAAEKTFLFFIVAAVVLAGVGVAGALFANYLAGVAVLLVSELLCHIPTVKVKNAVKRSNPTLSRLDLDEKTKAVLKKMSESSASYKLCKAIALVAAVAIIAVVFMNV